MAAPVAPSRIDGRCIDPGMNNTSPSSPFAIDREAAKLHKRWSLANDRFDRCTEATWYERSEAELAAREQLTAFLDANDLVGTGLDPRADIGNSATPTANEGA